MFAQECEGSCVLCVRHPPGEVSRVTKAKIAVYSCPFDAMGTETKGTVLLKSASELMEFSKGEEQLIEQVGGCVRACGYVRMCVCACVCDVIQFHSVLIVFHV